MGSPNALGVTNEFDVAQVKKFAKQMRRDIVTMLAEAKSGHPGGSLSACDCVATLYKGGVLRHNPKEPNNPARDRFILSKGHAAPVLYAALAGEGYFPREWLMTLRKLDSHLQGHPDMRKCPGVEVSTGSLGQGLSIASGLALGLSIDAAHKGCEPQKVFVLMGDGELQEGMVWEAAMFAAHRNLKNLIAIVDNNNLQIDGHLTDVVSLGNIAQKFESFGWHAIEVKDGNSIPECYEALCAARDYAQGPCVVVLHTIKGKGVSFMEDQAGWHGKAPSIQELSVALADIDGLSEEAE
ncbi:MAG: transketolase [Coriobacteriales bacterium]|nr:transketolase [Coriobacteriales bacterium]